MKYTVDQHMVNLERMLEKEFPGEECPWEKDRENLRVLLNRSDISFSELREAYDNSCQICIEFVGYTNDFNCPCGRFGKSEALKRTRLALEEYYEKH